MLWIFLSVWRGRELWVSPPGAGRRWPVITLSGRCVRVCWRLWHTHTNRAYQYPAAVYLTLCNLIDPITNNVESVLSLHSCLHWCQRGSWMCAECWTDSSSLQYLEVLTPQHFRKHALKPTKDWYQSCLCVSIKKIQGQFQSGLGKMEETAT